LTIFFGTEVFICSLEMVVGSLWKDSTYTLQFLSGAPLTAYYLHITVAGHSESKALNYYNCCWGPFWKWGIFTLQLLLGPLWKHIILH